MWGSSQVQPLPLPRRKVPSVCMWVMHVVVRVESEVKGLWDELGSVSSKYPAPRRTEGTSVIGDD